MQDGAFPERRRCLFVQAFVSNSKRVSACALRSDAENRHRPSNNDDKNECEIAFHHAGRPFTANGDVKSIQVVTEYAFFGGATARDPCMHAVGYA